MSFGHSPTTLCDSWARLSLINRAIKIPLIVATHEEVRRFAFVPCFTEDISCHGLRACENMIGTFTSGGKHCVTCKGVSETICERADLKFRQTSQINMMLGPAVLNAIFQSLPCDPSFVCAFLWARTCDGPAACSYSKVEIAAGSCLQLECTGGSGEPDDEDAPCQGMNITLQGAPTKDFS